MSGVAFIHTALWWKFRNRVLVTQCSFWEKKNKIPYPWLFSRTTLKSPSQKRSETQQNAKEQPSEQLSGLYEVGEDEILFAVEIMWENEGPILEIHQDLHEYRSPRSKKLALLNPFQALYFLSGYPFSNSRSRFCRRSSITNVVRLNMPPEIIGLAAQQQFPKKPHRHDPMRQFFFENEHISEKLKL